jgi:hypothetical protein
LGLIKAKVLICGILMQKEITSFQIFRRAFKAANPNQFEKDFIETDKR